MSFARTRIDIDATRWDVAETPVKRLALPRPLFAAWRRLIVLAATAALSLAGCSSIHTVEVSPQLGSGNLLTGVEMVVPVGGTPSPDRPALALCLRDAAGHCLTGGQVLGWGLLAVAAIGLAAVTFDKDDACDDWPNGWYSPLEARRGPQGQFTCETRSPNERGEWLCACLTDV